MKLNWNFPYQSTIWQKTRKRHLQKFPYCKICNKTFDLQVDHIIEHNQNYQLFVASNNLQTLCATCHGQKSQKHYQMSLLFKKGVKLPLTIKKAEKGLKIGSMSLYQSRKHCQFINKENGFTILLNDLDNLEPVDYEKVLELIYAIMEKWKNSISTISCNNLELKKYLFNSISKRYVL